MQILKYMLLASAASPHPPGIKLSHVLRYMECTRNEYMYMYGMSTPVASQVRTGVWIELPICRVKQIRDLAPFGCSSGRGQDALLGLLCRCAIVIIIFHGICITQRMQG